MIRVSPNANDVLIPFLNDRHGTYTNIGTAEANGNFTDYGNPISGVQGLFDDAMYFPSQYISSSSGWHIL